ncbi:hypothetical protein ACFV3R_15010 [Streptomyces sp. NPDC059740]|uniref:hypothetical protein n=1 Tax=Streptomyces sp. NPDC059740 TaxID=3346926 RepID=UPI0036539303
MNLPSLAPLLASGPSWLVPVLLGAGVLLAVAFAWLTVVRVRHSGWLSGIGPQAIVALGGVAVSVHGLYGFAQQTAGLPPELRVAFISVFDAAELVLLVMLYRTADPERGWTSQLRLMHRTAWTLVAFSAAMNAVHAPTWWARPVLAAVPALAAWLIELQLRQKLGSHTTAQDEQEGVRPGPARLLSLLWQHAWAALFAALGLDARSRGDVIARAAMAQRAAHRIYRLRLALITPRPTDGSRRARRAQHRIDRLRTRAQRMLDRADVATDPGQALAVARRLAALIRADEVAQLDYADAPAVLALIEDLAITPAAGRIEAGEHEAKAEDARRRAEAARQEAEAARQEAADARQRAEEDLAAAREELARLAEQHAAALAEQQGTAEEVQAARQRAEAARNEVEAARQRADAILATARTDADNLREEAQQALSELRRAAGEQEDRLRELSAQADLAQSRAAQAQQALEEVTARIGEAQALRDRLCGDLAEHAAQAPEGAAAGEEPLWRSPAKQAGWRHYLSTLHHSGGKTEPTASELAERFGVDGGNARNWLRDFRAARAAQLAAQPRATAARTPAGASAGSAA